MKFIYLLIFIIGSCSIVFAQTGNEVIIEKSKYDDRVHIEKSIQSTYYYFLDTVFLPDGDGDTYTATITVDQFVQGQTLTNINQLMGVCTSMEHSYMGDLTIVLVSPSNDTVIFTQYPNSCAATYLGVPIDDDGDLSHGIGFDYCWDINPNNESWDDACGQYQTLPAGNYSPAGSWTNLLGTQLNGDWTISVTDNLMSDNGYIFGWSIGFDLDLINLTRVEGQVFIDENEDCIFNGSDSPMESVWLEFLPGPHYTITDQNGNYFLYLDVGNYTASQYQINPLFDQTCLPGGEQTIEVLQVGDTVSNVDFANSADIYCPDLTVDIAAGVIRPCMQAQYTVQFSNHGTYPADNATIDIELPPEMTYVYAPWPSYQNGDLLTFDVFTINPGVTETFNIVVDVACDLELIGTTLCVEAHIHPDDPCVAPDPSWDHSSVAVEGSCEDSLACFNIENTGDPSGGDMQSTSEYRIYENNTLVYTGSFQLNGGESIDICWPANGNSIRLEADQHPAHPGNSHPQDIVEMCGDSLNGYVASLVNTVPQDDIDEFVEIFCLEVTASYDPNDKQVFPTGITEEHHYIDSSDVLEYFIRFQNTGNDTAFNIYVIDTISQYLEIASITPGVSSHPYYIEALSNEVVQFVFSDIMLPDSSTNEIASHGFVKFKINQKPGNPKGTVITNSAGIVFDYNIPVVTNTVFNTIGESNGIITSTPNVYDETVNIDVYPNPFSETTKFEVSNYNQSYSFHLYDITGREVSRINEIQSPSFTLNRNKIDNGVYIYKIVSKQKLIGSGKLIIQ